MNLRCDGMCGGAKSLISICFSLVFFQPTSSPFQCILLVRYHTREPESDADEAVQGEVSLSAHTQDGQWNQVREKLEIIDFLWLFPGIEERIRNCMFMRELKAG